MCTAISFQTKDHYFGRNLDLEYNYKECITITPRNYPFQYRRHNSQHSHYAVIGVATISLNYPLYYDATNEHGLSMAGLNFPDNAVYYPEQPSKDNIAPFELIPWVLGQCKTITEAFQLLNRSNIIQLPFSKDYPLSPLHWIIADKDQCITVESTKKGLTVHPNTPGVLTNNPPFDYHLQNLNNYINLTANEPSNRFSDKINLNVYSRGMGAIGLPGDLSSSSRFIRAVFTKFNSQCDMDELSSISQFFHILDTVSQTNGCTRVGDAYEKTIYTSCCNTNLGIYYYKTYNNNQITAINMFHENLEGKDLIKFPFRYRQNIFREN